MFYQPFAVPVKDRPIGMKPPVPAFLMSHSILKFYYHFTASIFRGMGISVLQRLLVLFHYGCDIFGMKNTHKKLDTILYCLLRIITKYFVKGLIYVCVLTGIHIIRSDERGSCICNLLNEL